MKTLTSLLPAAVSGRMKEIKSRIACFLFPHRFYVQLNFNSRARKLGCHRCKGAWVMYDDPTPTLVRWDDDVQRDAHLTRNV